MGTIEGQLISIEGDIQNANVVKDMILRQLGQDKVITDAQYEEYSENWRVLIYKKSWFHKIKAKDGNGWMYKFIKIENKNIKENVTLS